MGILHIFLQFESFSTCLLYNCLEKNTGLDQHEVKWPFSFWVTNSF